MCVWFELSVVYVSLFCFDKSDYDCMSTLMFHVRCYHVFEWLHYMWCDILSCVCVQCECSHFVILVRLCAMVQLTAFIEYVLCHRNPIHRAQYVNVSGCLCGSFIYIRRRASLLPRYFQKEPYVRSSASGLIQWQNVVWEPRNKEKSKKFQQFSKVFVHQQTASDHNPKLYHPNSLGGGTRLFLTPMTIKSVSLSIPHIDSHWRCILVESKLV